MRVLLVVSLILAGCTQAPTALPCHGIEVSLSGRLDGLEEEPELVWTPPQGWPLSGHVDGATLVAIAWRPDGSTPSGDDPTLHGPIEYLLAWTVPPGASSAPPGGLVPVLRATYPLDVDPRQDTRRFAEAIGRGDIAEALADAFAATGREASGAPRSGGELPTPDHVVFELRYEQPAPVVPAGEAFDGNVALRDGIRYVAAVPTASIALDDPAIEGTLWLDALGAFHARGVAHEEVDVEAAIHAALAQHGLSADEVRRQVQPWCGTLPGQE